MTTTHNLLEAWAMDILANREDHAVVAEDGLGHGVGHRGHHCAVLRIKPPQENQLNCQ